MAMTLPEPQNVLVPFTGEIVDLTSPDKVAEALDTVREMKRTLDEARSVLEEVLVAESAKQGTRTLHLERVDAVVSGGEKTEYDAETLASRLLELGLPAGRVAELVVTVVTYRVDQRVARSVAASNPAYATAIEECRQTTPAPWRVTIKKGTRQ